ncbi:hypothetical protein [Neisseria zalophi]|uniref:Uncharacterized protein n=1 Tax=Neisseria zalophi TaxID=640030 RepID=A0A5J6PTX8_9NEIS|nr:hypothetical protein [Neisseria zalophi]QEY26168.1 hypothetical protein D0T92_06260 [Neisseria zalophi]
MKTLNKEIWNLMNSYSLRLKKNFEIYSVLPFREEEKSYINNIEYCNQGISIILKEELLNEKDIDLFDITLEYKKHEKNKIYIHEIGILSSDGVVYLEFSELIVLEKEFLRFISLFLDEAIRLYEKNVYLYLKSSLIN